MIRDARYKLNLFHQPYDHSGAGEGELYDMVDDPSEQRNRWEDPAYSAIKATLLAKLRQWLRDNETQPGSRGGEILARVQMQNAGK